MDTELKIEQYPTSDLVPYARNAKKHTERQVEQIANSIREFSFNDPVGVWTNSDGQVEIVEGHGRVLAAKKLGMDTVPVIFLDRLTDEQRRAYTHVHNQFTMNTGFDGKILDIELGELDFEFEKLGFKIDPEENALKEGDEPFANYLDEYHEYIVLMFNNSVDAMWAQQVLGVETCDLVATGNHKRKGLGRVIDGVKAIENARG